jgi:hypothetical protein
VCSFGYDRNLLNKKMDFLYWDISNYGVLYRLSDGVTGMRFNDGSNIKLVDKIKSKYTFIPLIVRSVIYTDS